MRILFDPAPRQVDEIFNARDRARFFDDYDVIAVDEKNREAQYAAALPEIDILISQQDMFAERLAVAKNLKAIFNVETNFLPNIDYDECFRKGIHVLAPSSVFALPVAELALGMALSLARDIHGGHVAFGKGDEKYGLEGNARAELLTGSDMGFIGFGDLGKALLNLLKPFNARIRAYDPWLPDGYLTRQGIIPAGLEEVMQKSRIVFVVAAVTTENEKLIDGAKLALMQDGAMLLLISRAAVADFDALAAEAASGRLRIATDVFPVEPVASNDPIRKVDGMLLSAHRAGALTSALHEIGALVLDDIAQIAKGNPPVMCKRARPETVKRLRSKPVEIT